MNDQSNAETQREDKLLRSQDVVARLGVSRSYWWAGVKSGKFPAGIKLSSRVTVWKKSDVDALIARLGK